MIGKLFDKKRGASIPEGKRIYAIGDVHGCADLLERLLALIDADAAGAAYALVFLGDYVDRGPDSRGVLSRLVELAASDQENVFLKGNHEAAMCDFLLAPAANEEWLHWGGDKTLDSYGVKDYWDREPEETAADFANALPEAHKRFLRGLALTHTVGDYVFVHAGFKPGVALEAQSESDMLWIRSEFHNTQTNKRPDKTVVHGHHPVPRPLDAGWRIDVDTGAVWSSMLTALVLEGATRRFISTGRG